MSVNMTKAWMRGHSGLWLFVSFLAALGLSSRLTKQDLRVYHTWVYGHPLAPTCLAEDMSHVVRISIWHMHWEMVVNCI